MATKRKGPGRPPKSSQDRRDEYLDVRLDAAEKQAFKEAAQLAGVPLASWVRERLRRAAIRELEEVGREVGFIRWPVGDEK